MLTRGSKICPVEVKSSGYMTHASLNAFRKKYQTWIQNSYVLYTKDLQKGESGLLYLPVYMTPVL